MPEEIQQVSDPTIPLYRCQLCGAKRRKTSLVSRQSPDGGIVLSVCDVECAFRLDRAFDEICRQVVEQVLIALNKDLT